MSRVQVLESLQQITNDLTINFSNFDVKHSDFPNLDVPAATLELLKETPQDVQINLFTLKLMELIYGVYYLGTKVKDIPEESETNENLLKKIASQEVDWQFYEQLENNNYSRGWFHPDFQVLTRSSDGYLAVNYDSVTIYVHQDRHVKIEEKTASIGDLVSIWMPPSAIERELYTAIGEVETDNNSWKNPKNQIVLASFNFEAEAAIIAMKYLTQSLNSLGIPFVFKVLHNPLNYDRYNSGILQFHKSNYQLVKPILQTIYWENRPLFRDKIPLFSKKLSQGIGLSEHPHPQFLFNYAEDFGMNRCRIIANALMEAHLNNDESPQSRLQYMIKHFEQREIDLNCPYLNPGSEDIYTPLEFD